MMIIVAVGQRPLPSLVWGFLLGADEGPCDQRTGESGGAARPTGAVVLRIIAISRSIRRPASFRSPEPWGMQGRGTPTAKRNVGRSSCGFTRWS